METATAHLNLCFIAWRRSDVEELARLLALDASPAQWLLDKAYDGLRYLPNAAPNRQMECVRRVLAAGGDPWAVSYDAVCPHVVVAARLYVRGIHQTLLRVLTEAAPERFEEACMMGNATTSTGDELVALGHAARRLRKYTVLPALLFHSPMLTGRFDELARRVRKYAPSEEEVNAPNAIGATPLHMLCGSFPSGIMDRLRRAHTGYELLCAGADPLAVDNEGQTPRDVLGEIDTPLHRILWRAEDDTRERQLALAMGRHPRLGGNSLLALVSNDVLRDFIATTRQCLPPVPRSSSRADYALRLATTLEEDYGVRVYDRVLTPLEGCHTILRSNFEVAVRMRKAIDETLLRSFRLPWLGLHATGAQIRWARARLRPDASDHEVLYEIEKLFIIDGKLPVWPEERA